ncbi:hypothetical protein ACOCJ7_12225 [Knoellia sp. CPCC 206453]
MDADASLWSGASDSLGKAVAAVPALSIKFGRFEDSVGENYAIADKAVRASIVTGEQRLGAMATNVNANNTRTKGNDEDAGKRVTGAGRESAGGSGSDHDAGGKGKDHYAELMSQQAMPTDPKDREITFDRHVDPQTGEVTWSPRAMEPGESTRVDGRDVERIPQRADRIVVTMVNGEPQITYVDTDANAGPGGKGSSWQSDVATQPEARVVAGSGAQEPLPQVPQTEWSRPLPAGADYAVVEMRDGQPHVVFLDVQGGDVSELRDVTLADGVADRPVPTAVPERAPASQPVQTEARP